eukprot:2236025-Rhodomonas_salina.1
MQPQPLHDGALCGQIPTEEFHQSHLQALCTCHLLCQDLYLFTDLVEAQSLQILATCAPSLSLSYPMLAAILRVGVCHDCQRLFCCACSALLPPILQMLLPLPCWLDLG